MMWTAYIFREYDIRGIADRELTTQMCQRLGKAMGTYFQRGDAKTAVIGRDNRAHSFRIAQALMEGLCGVGINCLDIGMVPTPVQYFCMAAKKLPAGVQVTGSHNPPEYNGFKITLNGLSLYGKQIKEIEQIAKIEQFQIGRGKVEESDIRNQYLEAVLARNKLKRKLKVVLDAGNGMGSELGPEILKKMGCEVVPLYCAYDSAYPNHIPDPSVPNYMKDLTEAVVQNSADLGIALDGDCDRIGLVDEQGRLLYGDMLLLFYTYFLLKENQGAKIIFDVKCSRILSEKIQAWGGQPIMWKTGHSLIKAKLKEEEAALAGEMSGHMYFGYNYFGFDDALYGMAKAVEHASKWEGPLSTFFTDFPKMISTPEIRIPVKEEQKFAIVDQVKARFEKSSFHTIDLDGVRIETEKGWGLLRASNTQPVLVMRFEAEDKATLAMLKETLESEVKRCQKSS